MEADLATELSSEIEFLKQSISRSEQRIRQIVDKAGVILDQDEFADNPSNVTRLLNLLYEILSLSFTDFLILPISEPLSQTNVSDPVVTSATYIIDDAACLCDSTATDFDDGDVDLIQDEIEVKDEFWPASSQEYEPFTPAEEEDVPITEQPDQLELDSANNNQDQNLGFEFVAPHVAPMRRRKPKSRKKVVLPTTRRKLGPQRRHNTKTTGSKNTEYAKNGVSRSREVMKTPVKPNFRESASKIDLLKKKLHVEPIPSDDVSDHDDDADYTLPTSNSSSDEEYTPDVEPAPPRRQKLVSIKRKRSVKKKPSNLPPISSTTSHSDPTDRFVPVIDPTTGTEKFRCLDCSKIFVAGNLIYHRRIHTGEKPYPCLTCGIAFRARNVLESHCRRHHPTEKTEYFCDQCPKSFRQPEDLLIHKKLRHPKAVGKFFCPKCPKEFTAKAFLSYHVRTVHVEARRFKCEQCQMTFKLKCHLQRHEKTHLWGMKKKFRKSASDSNA